MGLFQKFKEGLLKSQTRLTHEIKRIVTRSPRLTVESFEELEVALLGADLGMAATTRIMESIRKAYESQGSAARGVAVIAQEEVEKILRTLSPALKANPSGPTVISMVGVNGTGKTTSSAKLAYRFQQEGKIVLIAACDTFRAAAIEQISLWGERLKIPVVAGAYGADPASVAHDAVTAALARKADFLVMDTAGRLHTKNNLMQELQKVHRVIGRQLPGAPHEVLLVLDGSTGMNALNQAREFHKAVALTGLVVTKLDGTSKGGMVVAIQQELNLPVKFIGLGEKAEDLQPFEPAAFAEAMFSEKT